MARTTKIMWRIAHDSLRMFRPDEDNIYGMFQGIVRVCFTHFFTWILPASYSGNQKGNWISD
jgi:hypothetical protein